MDVRVDQLLEIATAQQRSVPFVQRDNALLFFDRQQIPVVTDDPRPISRISFTTHLYCPHDFLSLSFHLVFHIGNQMGLTRM